MPTGVSPTELSADDLLRELSSLYDTRLDTLRHGSDQSLHRHNLRMSELEAEYARRFPQREIRADRLRAGARAR